MDRHPDWDLAEEAARPLAFDTYDLAALSALPPPRWLLRDRLPEGISVLYGPPKAGKSFVALDWSLALASGVGQGGDPMTVLYCAGEGISGLGQRVDGWQQAHPDLSPSGFRVLPATPHLMDGYAVDRLVGTIDLLKPTLLVLDTWARAMVGADENSVLDVQRAIAILDGIREGGTSTLIVHHSNASGDRERGSTALRGAVDAMWKLEDNNAYLHGRSLSCVSMKDHEQPTGIDLSLIASGYSCVVYPSTAHFYAGADG